MSGIAPSFTAEARFDWAARRAGGDHAITAASMPLKSSRLLASFSVKMP